MIRRRALFAIVAMGWTTIVQACDLPFPKRGSLVEWPEHIVAVRVKVLKVDVFPNGIDLLTRVRVLQTIKGNVPRVFVIASDRSSCGAIFRKGEVLLTGVMRHPSVGRDGTYTYEANSYTESWVRAVFVDKSLILAE